MPIKGVSEQRRLTRLGKIRLGIKSKNSSGREYPKAVNYFVCDQDESTSKEASELFGRSSPNLCVKYLG